jgi:hypothetical protein
MALNRVSCTQKRTVIPSHCTLHVRHATIAHTSVSHGLIAYIRELAATNFAAGATHNVVHRVVPRLQSVAKRTWMLRNPRKPSAWGACSAPAAGVQPVLD